MIFDLTIHHPAHLNRENTTIETLDIDDVRAEVESLQEKHDNLPVADSPTLELIWEDAKYRKTGSFTEVIEVLDKLEGIIRAGNLGEAEIAAYYQQWNEWPYPDTLMRNINPIGNYAEAEPEAILGRYAAKNEIFTDDEGKPLDSKVIEYLDFAAVGRHVGGHVYTINGTTWWQPAI